MQMEMTKLGAGRSYLRAYSKVSTEKESRFTVRLRKPPGPEAQAW